MIEASAPQIPQEIPGMVSIVRSWAGIRFWSAFRHRQGIEDKFMRSTSIFVGCGPRSPSPAQRGLR